MEMMGKTKKKKTRAQFFQISEIGGLLDPFRPSMDLHGQVLNQHTHQDGHGGLSDDFVVAWGHWGHWARNPPRKRAWESSRWWGKTIMI